MMAISGSPCSIGNNKSIRVEKMQKGYLVVPN